MKTLLHIATVTVALGLLAWRVFLDAWPLDIPDRWVVRSARESSQMGEGGRPTFAEVLTRSTVLGAVTFAGVFGLIGYIKFENRSLIALIALAGAAIGAHSYRMLAKLSFEQARASAGENSGFPSANQEKAPELSRLSTALFLAVLGAAAAFLGALAWDEPSWAVPAAIFGAAGGAIYSRRAHIRRRPPR